MLIILLTTKTSHTLLEDLVVEILSAEPSLPSPKEVPDYLGIVERAHRSVMTLRSIEEIDADLERQRNEW